MGEVVMPYHKDCRHWAGGPRCMNWACHCMASQFYLKLQPFLSYYGDSNMCDCTYKQQADAWMAVWDTLMKGNPTFVQGGNGQSSAVREIERLFEAEKRLNAMKHERDAQNFRANAAEALIARAVDDRNAAQRERNEESGRKNHALNELDRERQTSAALNTELMKVRRELSPPTMGGGADTHRQNVRKAVARYAQNDSRAFANHPRHIAEAVYYLLDRDQLQTAAIKCLSERLDALEPNRKQAADQCGQGFSPAPWQMQQPSGGFNPG